MIQKYQLIVIEALAIILKLPQDPCTAHARWIVKRHRQPQIETINDTWNAAPQRKSDPAVVAQPQLLLRRSHGQLTARKPSDMGVLGHSRSMQSYIRLTSLRQLILSRGRSQIAHQRDIVIEPAGAITGHHVVTIQSSINSDRDPKRDPVVYSLTSQTKHPLNAKWKRVVRKDHILYVFIINHRVTKTESSLLPSGRFLCRWCVSASASVFCEKETNICKQRQNRARGNTF